MKDLFSSSVILFPLICLLLVFSSAFVAHRVSRVLEERGNPYSEPVWSGGVFLLPVILLLNFLLTSAGLTTSHRVVKIVETVLGIGVIWFFLSLMKSVVLARTGRRKMQPRVSGLVLDLFRLVVVVVGALVVVATVWEKDLTSFLATLGVGSLVLGLALQETLGNLFAGIALAFERPFKEGDWVKVGDLIGEVIETNWRAIRLRDRNHVTIVVPNSVLGRERIENFSLPTKVVGVLSYVGFAYSDPPNKVKKVLLDILKGVPGVVFDKVPRIRTKEFGDFAVTYEIKFFIRDYFELPEIEEEFKTKIWYAARRHGLNIPFPIRMVYKTELPPKEIGVVSVDTRELLSHVPLFAPLRREELESLARDVMTMEFGHGETILEQGGVGDSLFIIQSGSVSIRLKDDQKGEREVAHLGKGEFFGEMALLAGEPRTASVVAATDVSVLVVYREAFKETLSSRPELAAQIAEIAEGRRAGLRDRQAPHTQGEVQERVKDRTTILVSKIRSIFGLDSARK